MSTTVREEGAIEFDASTLVEQWSLVVAHHRLSSVLGLRRVVTATTALDLGRACGAFGEGALDDPQLSRAHARVELGSRGVLVVSDLGSANGTWVDGARVGTAPLREGAVLRTGPVLFVVQRAPETYPMRRSEKAPAVSWRTVAFVESVRAALAAKKPIAIRGARRSAWWPIVQWLASERDLTVLAAESQAQAKSAGDGVVCVVRAGAIEEWALIGRAIYVEDHSSSDDSVSTALAVATMPRVSERIEDIPWLVRGALGRALTTSPKLPAMDAGFAARLLAAEWPEDVDGIERWAEAVARRPERHEKLEWVGEDLSFAGGPRVAIEPSSSSPGEGHERPRPTPVSAAPGDAALIVARDGGWFRTGREAAVDLRTRFALARIMRALVRAHERAPEETLSLDALIDEGWPGEKLVSDSGSNRVYVAIATLRKLGLRERIERREGGYRLSPRATIVVDDEFEQQDER